MLRKYAQGKLSADEDLLLSSEVSLWNVRMNLILHQLGEVIDKPKLVERFHDELLESWKKPRKSIPVRTRT